MTKGTARRERLIGAIDRMQGIEVLVIADLVLDVFEYGEIGRISREAPVLILNHVRTDRLPGGGANAASNLRSLGARPVLIGRVGTDSAGDRLLTLLNERGIDVAGVWRDESYRTPVKRRVLAGSPHSAKQQIVRVDRGGGPPVDPRTAPLLEAVRAAADRTRGTLISDYSLGLLHPGTIHAIRETSGGDRRPFCVDSRSQLLQFKHLTAATPNLQEAEAVLGEPVGNDPDKLLRAGRAIREALDADAVVVTRGSLGMSLFARGGESANLSVYGTDEVADVTGAGDTVISTFTLAILSGCSYTEAALLANYAGGIVVTKRGTATIGRHELAEAVRRDADFERRLTQA